MMIDLNTRRKKRELPKEFANLVSQAIRVLWLEYDEADTTRKREILLSLRHLHRALPPHIQVDLWQEWYRWLDVFEQEEIACGERPESDRLFEWGPHVREALS